MATVDELTTVLQQASSNNERVLWLKLICNCNRSDYGYSSRGLIPPVFLDSRTGFGKVSLFAPLSKGPGRHSMNNVTSSRLVRKLLPLYVDCVHRSPGIDERYVRNRNSYCIVTPP